MEKPKNKAKEYDIVCIICGAKTKSKSKHGKYCKNCRIVKNKEYNKNRAKRDW